MLDFAKLIYHQVIEALAQGGVRNVFHPRVFWNRVATPVVMELSTFSLSPTSDQQSTNFQFVEIKLEDLKAGKWFFATPSRRVKALQNLKKDLRCFAIVDVSTVVGDVWCITPSSDSERISHADLEMLGINSEAGDVYAFDMLIVPLYRGKNLAVPLQKALHAALKAEGYLRVYGFYWNDNLPALWMHRMLKYKELPKRLVSRFFFLLRSKAVDSDKAAYQKLPGV